MANFNEKIALTFDVDASKAQDGFKHLGKVLSDLESDENDARTTGQKMAAVMDAAADDLAANFKQARSASDALAASLGEDGVQAFKDAGRSVDDLVSDLKVAGLTYADIEADTDQLAGSLKKLNGVGREMDTHITKNLQGVARESDRSRSVFANFTGNAIQELPGVGNAFGPLNMAIGQFGEYATEGNIKLSGLIGTGLGVGVVAVAMSKLADQSKRAAEVKAFRKESVEAYAKALREGAGQAKAIADHLNEAGKIELKRGGVLGSMFNGDITDAFARAGLTVDQFSQYVQGGEKGLQNLETALTEAGVPAADIARILLAAGDQLGYIEQAAKTAAVTTKVFGNAAEKAGEQAKTAGKWSRSFAEGLDAIGSEWDTLNGKLDSENAFWELHKTLQDTTASTYDQQKATAEYIQTVLGMPPTAATKILALIDQGKLKEAEDELNNLVRARDATVMTKVSQGSAHGGTAGGRVQAIEGQQTTHGERSIVIQNAVFNTTTKLTPEEVARLLAEWKRRTGLTPGETPRNAR